MHITLRFGWAGSGNSGRPAHAFNAVLPRPELLPTVLQDWLRRLVAH